MKRFVLFFVLLITIIIVNPVVCFAQPPIQVYLDNQKIDFANPPIIENGITFVEFRPIFEKLGLNVKWYQATQSVVGNNQTLNIELQIGSNIATINGEERVMSVYPKIFNGYTIVPLRFVSEATGKTVNWDEAKRRISICTNNTNQSVAEVQEYGSIKGTITYQYNKFIGSRGDVGAMVVLIKRDLAPGSAHYDFKTGRTGKLTSIINNSVYRVAVDGYGHYEINNIPSGDYIIIINSCEAWDYSQVIDPGFASLVKPYFDDTYDDFVKNHTCLRKHIVDTISIEPNTTVNYNYDFGFSE